MRPARWMVLLRLGACCGLGMVLAVLALVGLMFADQMAMVRALVASGEPLAGLALWVLPEALWSCLAGFPGAAANPMLHSLLSLCSALTQVALLTGLMLYRWWYAR